VTRTVYGRLAGTGMRLVKAELAAAAALALVALGVLVFVGVADEIVEGERAFDEAILAAMRIGADAGAPIGPPWLLRAAQELTGFGDTWILAVITVIAIGFLMMLRKPGQALLAAVSIVGGTLLSEGLKTAFARERPDLAWRLAEAHSLSFPSGHAMLSAVTYLTLGALIARVLTRRRLRAYVLGVAFSLAGVVGLTRIYLGVHWTTDVVAGWALGAAWAMACWLAAYAVERVRRSRVAPPPLAESPGERGGGSSAQRPLDSPSGAADVLAPEAGQTQVAPAATDR
jgi:undecaprenyl-diphosphatase